MVDFEKPLNALWENFPRSKLYLNEFIRNHLVNNLNRATILSPCDDKRYRVRIISVSSHVSFRFFFTYLSPSFKIRNIVLKRFFLSSYTFPMSAGHEEHVCLEWMAVLWKWSFPSPGLTGWAQSLRRRRRSLLRSRRGSASSWSTNSLTLDSVSLLVVLRVLSSQHYLFLKGYGAHHSSFWLYFNFSGIDERYFHPCPTQWSQSCDKEIFRECCFSKLWEIVWGGQDRR